MAIARMTKIMIVSHRSEVAELLEALQQEGIVEVLDADRAIVSKEWSDLQTEQKRPRELDDVVAQLDKAIAFMEEHAVEKGLATVLRPLAEVKQQRYTEVVSGEAALNLLEEVQRVQSEMDTLGTEYENTLGILESLVPWKSMTTPVEQLTELEATVCVSGLLPHAHYDELCQQSAPLGAVIEQVGSSGNMHACLVVCMNEVAGDVQKLLRIADFETVSFEGMSGTVVALIEQCEDKLARVGIELGDVNNKAAELARDRLNLQILFDHYRNLSIREQTRMTAPATESTVLLEGWVKTRDFKELEEIVASFSAATVSKIEPGEDEDIPIEIDNNEYVKPFETVTRLHGMPTLADVDPTAFLAPFFALSFGLCLTDAGYGIIMAGVLWWLIKKLQGDKKALWMFFICSGSTVVAGALTGGWFGDAFQVLLPKDTAVFNMMNAFREKLMLFDPMADPMKFFVISLALGYIQIMFALFIGFFNNLLRKDYATAIFNFFAWILFLNSLAVIGLSKSMAVPAGLAAVAKWIAISMAVIIFLFTERKSGIAGRIGGGVFSLFSTVFYFGDILSYVRLMALGMVTAGLGMAVNILVVLVMKTPYIGFILGALLFVVGHTVNLALSVLSSFVHSLRLQFVEFFPKFFTGGGKAFKPLKLSFKHLLIETEKTPTSS